ncbi:MAG: hypothetical protein F6J98_02270 [Moorea sp. SIO4G2]|nr:hypothetical protein [Moorena sp. SIO4G2]
MSSNHNQKKSKPNSKLAHGSNRFTMGIEKQYRSDKASTFRLPLEWKPIFDKYKIDNDIPYQQLYDRMGLLFLEVVIHGHTSNDEIKDLIEVLKTYKYQPPT